MGIVVVIVGDVFVYELQPSSGQVLFMVLDSKDYSWMCSGVHMGSQILD